jgi:hypothetical protein
MYDSAGDDILNSTPLQATLSGNGFLGTATGYPVVNVFASEGMDEAVKLEDSADDDEFRSTPEWVELEGPTFFIRAESFDIVHAYANNGGNDKAVFSDALQDGSNQKVKFKAEPDDNYAKMYNSKTYNRAKKFETIVATATMGGRDMARVFDSAGNDMMVTQKDASHFYNDNTNPYDVTVNGFDYQVGYSLVGGHDTATFHDTPGEDVFVGKSHKSKMFDNATDGEAYELTARGFDDVTAHGGEGDIAKLWDTAVDDVLEAKYLSNGDSSAKMTSQDGLDTLYEAIAFETAKGYGTTGKNTKDLAADVNFMKWWGEWDN